MEEKYPKKVELTGILLNPNGKWHTEDFASAAARGCFSELSSSKIQAEESVKADYEQRKEVIFKETSGRGHGAVLDKGIFNWSIDNLTRASTLFLCGPQYASHLQQSLRRATAERGFLEIDSEFDLDTESESEMGLRGFKEIKGIDGNRIMDKQFELYGKMVDAGIPTEDARIILPLNTKTTIDTTWDARELMHLKSMADRMNVTSDVLDTVNIMYEQARGVAPALMKEREKNFEVLAWMPSNQLYSRENAAIEAKIMEVQGNSGSSYLLDYSLGLKMSDDLISRGVLGRDEAILANLKHTHFTFFVPMSLMSFHQATRQRTWDQSVESLEKAVVRGNFVLPPSIRGTDYEMPLNELAAESRKYVLNNFSANSEVLGVVPHSLEVYDLIHINGWNALHSIGKRTCKTAQWEIRAKANVMAKEIRDVYPELGKYCLPQGILYGSCPERENCGMCKTGGYDVGR